MINITLKQLAEWIDCDIDAQYLDVEIKGVTIDSRHIQHGQLFIPFKGENVDGHQYSEQALNDGAGATFFQRDSTLTAPTNGPVVFVEKHIDCTATVGKGVFTTCGANSDCCHRFKRKDDDKRYVRKCLIWKVPCTKNARQLQ